MCLGADPVVPEYVLVTVLKMGIGISKQFVVIVRETRTVMKFELDWS